MESSKENIAKFDAYLNHQMNEEEKLFFESELLHNKALQEEFNFHNFITQSIANEKEDRFREILKSQQENSYIGNNTWGKKFTIAASIIMLLGLSALLISYLKDPDFAKTFAKKTKKTAQDTMVILKKDSAKIVVKENLNPAAEVTLSETENNLLPSPPTPESSAFEKRASAENNIEDIESIPFNETEISRKDKENILTEILIKTVKQEVIIIPKINLEQQKLVPKSTVDRDVSASDKKADNNLGSTKGDTQKIKAIKVISKSIIIEFFKTPLNYQGFNLAENNETLKIYGFEKNTAMVFIYENLHYVKIDNKLYSLLSNGIFSKPNLITNIEITKLFE